MPTILPGRCPQPRQQGGAWPRQGGAMSSPQPKKPRPRTWREIAVAQSGVLSRQQALSGGLTEDAWDWKLGRHWTRIGAGVAVTHSGPPTEHERRWAAVLHGGPQAALDGDAALAAR